MEGIKTNEKEIKQMTIEERDNIIAQYFDEDSSFDERIKVWRHKRIDNLYAFTSVEEWSNHTLISFIRCDVKQNLKFLYVKHAVNITFTTKEELEILIESV